jgi:hypothetical protein
MSSGLVLGSKDGLAEIVDRFAEIVMGTLHPGTHCVRHLHVRFGLVGPELPVQLGVVGLEPFLVGPELFDLGFQLCAAIFWGHEPIIRPRASGGTEAKVPKSRFGPGIGRAAAARAHSGTRSPCRRCWLVSACCGASLRASPRDGQDAAPS